MCPLCKVPLVSIKTYIFNTMGTHKDYTAHFYCPGCRLMFNKDDVKPYALPEDN